MQTKGILVRVATVALVGAIAGFGLTAEAAPATQSLYSSGSQRSFAGPEKYFTGKVRVEMLFPGNDTAHYSGAYVSFAPGARTAWHMHPAGQHMIVTRGTALTGTRAGKVIEFKQGESIWCPPNIDHWHGATPDAPMTHLVITGSRDGKNVIWQEKVSATQYYGNTHRKEKDMVDINALTARQQAIIPVAAFTATGDLERLKSAIDAGLNAGLSVNEIKEIQIQLYAYAGFPRALNGLATSMGVLDQRKAKGIDDPVGKQAVPFPSDKDSLDLGKAVQTQLSGKPVAGPLFDFAPAINELLQRHLFGDLFARDVLDYQEREVVTLSALASMEGVDSQLAAHVRIATNVGLTRDQLTALAGVLKTAVGTREGDRAEHAIQSVLPEGGQDS